MSEDETTILGNNPRNLTSFTGGARGIGTRLHFLCMHAMRRRGQRTSLSMRGWDLLSGPMNMSSQMMKDINEGVRIIVG